MTHRATLHHLPGLKAVAAIVVLLGLGGPALARDFKGVASFAVVFVIVCWRFRRMRLTLDDAGLFHRGWVRERRVAYSSIRKVTRPCRKGWPYDRWYSSEVHRIEAADTSVTLNLLWYGPAGAREFMDRLGSSRSRGAGEVHHGHGPMSPAFTTPLLMPRREGHDRQPPTDREPTT